jgi:hypothetical protein
MDTQKNTTGCCNFQGRCNYNFLICPFLGRIILLHAYLYEFLCRTSSDVHTHAVLHVFMNRLVGHAEKSNLLGGGRGRHISIVISGLLWEAHREIPLKVENPDLVSCCRTAVGVGQRALSLFAHTAGDPPPPPPGPGEGGVTTPYSWSIAGTTATSLLRGTGGINHPRESLNPSLHTGGPCRGRSFRRRLHRWCVAWIMERGDDVVCVRRRL